MKKEWMKYNITVLFDNINRMNKKGGKAQQRRIIKSTTQKIGAGKIYFC